MTSEHFNKAIAKFDEYNTADPKGSEVLYAQRMSDRLNKFQPGAPEHIQLAIRCQHIGRWQIPRNTYPEGKKGYIAWRNKLKDHHAEIAGRIMTECGYDHEMIGQVQDLLEKKDLRNNPDTKLLEDVVCLVFVEFYLDDFAGKHDDAKVIDILAKTFRKMTPAAVNAASEIPLSSKAKDLFDRAASVR
ncbi:MAG TPA: DUF4202 domain-containing protein [Cyclobacteriaceae bacterium]|nr:DUF4202 domain-containing protein [Cyclobacteriaceae bacterium]